MKKNSCSILKIIISLSLLTSSGCTAMIAGAFISNFPSYQDVASEIPAIPEEAGRVIIYFPSKKGMVNGGFTVVNITIDGQMKTTLGDGTFIFTDLAEGKHLISIKKGPFDKAEIIETQVVNKNVSYIKVVHGFFTTDTPMIVAEIDAIGELENIHHNYNTFQIAKNHNFQYIFETL